MAAAGVCAGGLYKHLTGNRLIIDTGDVISALGHSLGRGLLGMCLTRGLEAYGLRAADQLVVRGTYHARWLATRGIRAEVIHDGVETDIFTPGPARGLLCGDGLEQGLTIGMLGSCVWSERSRTCYGWDLIELIRLLRNRPVVGVVIGGGSGIPVLKARCREYGIEERVKFLGNVPYERLPHHLRLIDVCLSTQTNDLTGRVRTTGKLPLYLACGRYVLASRVGEAALVLPDDMLVEYDGTFDPHYPHKLAERIRRLLDDRTLLRRGLENVATARCRFDYAVLAERVWQVIEAVSGAARLAPRPPTPTMTEARV
jgi:glycosyltransferase involved in cell wall biosynthesis